MCHQDHVKSVTLRPKDLTTEKICVIFKGCPLFERQLFTGQILLVCYEPFRTKIGPQFIPLLLVYSAASLFFSTIHLLGHCTSLQIKLSKLVLFILKKE